MPVYDYECDSCKTITESIEHYNTEIIVCERCNHCFARRIISASGPNCANQDAEWIRSVLEVVDKEGGKHCQRFLKNPTRKNYNAYMKGEGIRPLESGEQMRPPIKNRKEEEAITRDVIARSVSRFTPQQYEEYNRR